MKSIRIQLSHEEFELVEQVRRLGFSSRSEVLRLAALGCLPSADEALSGGSIALGLYAIAGHSSELAHSAHAPSRGKSAISPEAELRPIHT